MVIGVPGTMMIAAVRVTPGLIIGHGHIAILMRAAMAHFNRGTPVARVVVRIITAGLVMIGVGIGDVMHRIDVAVAGIIPVMFNRPNLSPSMGRAVVTAAGLGGLARYPEQGEGSKGCR